MIKKCDSNEITINFTDEERTNILKKKSLRVVPWNKDKEMEITDSEESIAKALRRYSLEQGLIDKMITFNEFDEPIKFTKASLRESIAQMRKQGSNLVNLGKMLSVLELICLNAVKIEVEKYRHVWKKGQKVKQTHQLLGAFCDEANIYPVKITIHEKINKTNQFYMVITVGKVRIPDIKKEGLSNTGAGHLKQEMSGSLPHGGASFDINIPSIISYFKRREKIILKNLPDGLLSEEQRRLKEKVIKKDKEKDQSKLREIQEGSKPHYSIHRRGR